jgi:hypothetical protein
MQFPKSIIGKIEKTTRSFGPSSSGGEKPVPYQSVARIFEEVKKFASRKQKDSRGNASLNVKKVLTHLTQTKKKINSFYIAPPTTQISASYAQIVRNYGPH